MSRHAKTLAAGVPADMNLHAAAEGFATVDQAGAFLSLSRATIYNLMDAGELASAKFGKSRRIPWSAIKAYAAKALAAS